MGLLANIEGFEGQKIEAKVSFWTGPRLFVKGVPAPKGLRRGEMVLQRNDGRQIYAVWKPQILGLDVPKLVVDGKTINLAPPLKWYQWIWSALPILLIFWGGLMGAITGVIAFSINTNIFRSSQNEAMNYALTGVVSVLAVIVYIFAALIFYMLTNG